MAKKQSFGDKASKKKAAETHRSVKLVYSVKSQKTGAWRFAEKFVKVPLEGDEVKVLEETYNKSV